MPTTNAILIPKDWNLWFLVHDHGMWLSFIELIVSYLISTNIKLNFNDHPHISFSIHLLHLSYAFSNFRSSCHFHSCYLGYHCPTSKSSNFNFPFFIWCIFRFSLHIYVKICHFKNKSSIHFKNWMKCLVLVWQIMNTNVQRKPKKYTK